MYDDAILLHALKYIKRETANSTYVDLGFKIWKDYTDEKKQRLRYLLLKYDLIRSAPDFLRASPYVVRLSENADAYIEQQDKKLEKKFLKFINRKRDVKSFMVEHFVKPNPFDEQTTNENDDGVNFLKSLKEKNLVEYNGVALRHVNIWTVDADGKEKRWFDTLHEPFLVTRHPRLSQLSNNQFVLKHIKYAIKNGTIYGVKFIISLWKFIVLIAATAIGGWLALDHNFLDAVHFFKRIFFK
jgi:hypothetical protein